MSVWDEPGWYDHADDLASALARIETAGLRGADALTQIRRSAEYIRRMYGEQDDE